MLGWLHFTTTTTTTTTAKTATTAKTRGGGACHCSVEFCNNKIFALC